MNSLLFKLVIDGTNVGAIKALAGVSSEAKRAGADLAKLDGSTDGLSKTRGDLTALSGQLVQIRSLALQALSFAGIGAGVSQIIQLADTYSNMTGRLRLATQYSGNFNEMLGLLQGSASATRSDLAATVDLFVKMSPALQGIGLSGAPAVGIITAINQAIGLSGAGAQAAAAALMQLGQGFGSGVLRGEELNSILEQTPGLAQAIADGLGVPIGELRKLGEQGELTAEKVATALQKVAPQIEADFAKMPKTVGQALTELQNQFLVFVGQADAATGGTSVLAALILELAAAFRDGAPPIVAVTEALKIMVNGLDGAYRMIKIVGLGLAAYAAAAKAALTGDFSGAREIWRLLGQDIDAVLQQRLLTDRQSVESATGSARKRELLEAQLAAQQERLEKAKAYVAGATLDSIAAKEKENIDKRIADQQRLVDAVRSAWQSSLKEAESAANQAQSLFDKAAAKRSSVADKAFNFETKGMSPEDQVAAARQRGESLFADGSYYAAAANAARLDGRFKEADQYQKNAERFLERAEAFADKSGDIDLVKNVGSAQASLLESQAKAKQDEANQLQQQAADQAQLLGQLQAQLEALQKSARQIEVKADITDAETKVKGLQAQLDALKDKAVTVTVNTVGAGASAPVDDSLPARAYGGPLPGSAPHDRADNMLYWGTPGEWVIQRPAVRYYGAGLLASINAMRLPKFAMGGELGGLVSRLRVPSISSAAPRSSSLAAANFYLDGRRYGMQGEPDVIRQLGDHFAREALRKGGRR